MKIKGYYLSCYDLDELREIALAIEAESLDDYAAQIIDIINGATPIKLEVSRDE